MTDTLGNVAWAKSYDLVGSVQELAVKVVRAPFGYVLSGRSTTSGMARCFLMGVSHTGNVLWAKQYGAPNDAHTPPHVYTHNLTALDDGFLMVTTVQGLGGTDDMLLVRTDLQGNTCGAVNEIALQTTVLPTDRFLPGLGTGALSATVAPANTVTVATDVTPPCALDADLGPDTALCGTFTIAPSPQPGATYTWQDGTTLDHLVVEFPGTYWVEVTIGCCEVRDTIVVSHATGAVEVDLGPDTLVCAGEALTLSTGLIDGEHYWQGVPGGMDTTVSTPGTYWVEVMSDGCTARDTIVIQVLAPNAVDLGPDLVVCADSTASFTLPSQLEDPVWSNGSSDHVFIVDDAGTIWFTGNMDGCFVTDTIQVHLVDPPVVDLGPDTMLCPGNSLILATGHDGFSHLWQDGSASEVLLVDAPGIYWVAVGAGCPGSDSITVSMPMLPEPDLGADTVICTGDQLVLEAMTGAWDVEWSDGSTAGTFMVLSSGTYWVELSLGGCLSSDTVVVGGAAWPTVELGADTVLCNGTPVQIIAQAGAASAYLWSTGGQAPTLTATVSGTYWVEVQNGCGSDRDSITVTIVPAFELELGPDLILCEPIMHVLTSGQAAEHSTWQDGSHGLEFVVTRPGTYSVTVEIQGCSEQDEVTIGMTGLPEMEVSSDTLLCEADPVWLQAQALDGSTVLWPDGSTDAMFLAATAGTYMVSAMNGCGVFVDSIRVLHAPPFPYLTDQLVCPGASAFVPAPAGVQQVQWSTGEVSAPVVLPVGVYAYLMVDASGCDRTGNFTVLVDPEADGAQYVPNVFTPNGDGTNDVFQVVGAERTGFSLRIYDRWGLLLFESSSGRSVWDGRAKGGEVPEGVYCYVVTYRARCGDRGLITRTGHVTLLR